MLPLGAVSSPRSQHKSLVSMLVSSFAVPASLAQGSPSQNAQAAVTHQGVQVRTDDPMQPSTHQALVPAASPVLGKWPVWLQAPQQTGSEGKCRVMYHPFELAWAACSFAPQNVRAIRLVGLFYLMGGAPRCGWSSLAAEGSLRTRE
jgi:hypothetical protein